MHASSWRRLRIAQVSPLAERVPPTGYGGTERVVATLTEQLVETGHDVTLFASGDSITNARLMSPCMRSLRLDPHCLDRLAYQVLQMEQVFSLAHEFDVIHFHTDYLHFPLSRRHHVCTLTTLHGRLDLRDLVPIYREYRDMPVVSISNAQRDPLPWLNWIATVYHGLPRDLYTPREESGTYLAFLGRISPEKRVDLAIEIARRSGMDIRIAAKVDPTDREYFDEIIAPLLRQPHVEYLGEMAEGDKSAFLGQAYAMLFPIDWPEPFGLVMIESMACGTPVIAFRRGSVPEVMEDGVTGFVVETVEEAVAAVHRCSELSRRRCREVFERRFSVERMANDYLAHYRKLMARHGRHVATV
jgi:glycosyltransferase involved in cell wall biosynthesis